MRTTAADTTQSNSHLYPARNVQPNTIHRSFSVNEQSAVATCKFFRSHSLKASFPGTVALTCHKAKHLQQKLFCEGGDSGKPIPLTAFSLQLLAGTKIITLQLATRSSDHLLAGTLH